MARINTDTAISQISNAAESLQIKLAKTELSQLQTVVSRPGSLPITEDSAFSLVLALQEIQADFHTQGLSSLVAPDEGDGADDGVGEGAAALLEGMAHAAEESSTVEPGLDSDESASSEVAAPAPEPTADTPVALRNEGGLRIAEVYQFASLLGSFDDLRERFEDVHQTLISYRRDREETLPTQREALADFCSWCAKHTDVAAEERVSGYVQAH